MRATYRGFQPYNVRGQSTFRATPYKNYPTAQHQGSGGSPPVPRADLTKYNQPRRASYQPRMNWKDVAKQEYDYALKATFPGGVQLSDYFTKLQDTHRLERQQAGKPVDSPGSPPDSLTEWLWNTYVAGFKYSPSHPPRSPYGVVTRGGRTADYASLAQLREPSFSGHKEAQLPVGARTYGLPQPKTDQYGRPLNVVDPALMEKVMTSPPGTRAAFNPSIPRSGEEFYNYMMDEGVLPHFGAPSNVTNIHSGRWTDYLLNRMGVYSFGVNPYASPQQNAGRYGSGGGGYGGYPRGGGGYAPYEPEPPKQYGNIRNTQGRNLDQWLMDLVSWTI